MNLSMLTTWRGWLRLFYVLFAFCLAFLLGALKGILVGPLAGMIIILGNVAIILGLFPSHAAWTIYTAAKTPRFDAPLKVAIFLGLPVLFSLWLGVSIGGSILVGVGYGFFTPWVSAFEAFRQEKELKKYLHCVVDGTWGTIKGSCTVVRDFADFCYHSYPLYLKEIRESPSSIALQPLRFIQVPGIITVGLMGLIVEIPSYTVIAIVKSPYMLFKGWQRLLHDLISREGPFLETACIPIAGLAILFWPLFVIGSVVFAVFSSIFIALNGSVVAYQERSFKRGMAYLVAMIAEFDEYTNDLLYLREGTILPKPRYQKKKISNSSELGGQQNHSRGGMFSAVPMEAAAIFMPGLTPSRSVREAIHDVKMVQVWESLMQSCQARGKELVEANVITKADLDEWLKGKSGSEATIAGVGLPAYACLYNVLQSIKAGANGLLLIDGLLITNENRPQDRLLDWFFHPVMLLKEHIMAIKLSDDEISYLQKSVLLGSHIERMEAWENGGFLPKDPVRAAQLQGISRRLTGMMRSVTKLPTYRRKFHRVVKALAAYHAEKEGSSKSGSVRSVPPIEIV